MFALRNPRTEAPPLTTIAQILNAAVRHHRTGRFDRAAPLYRLILLWDPTNPDGLHLLGLTERAGGRTATAAALMARGLRINATLAGRHADLGHALNDLGRVEEATRALTESLRRQPDQVDLLLTLARLARRLDDYPRALRAARVAIASQPDLAEAYHEAAATRIDGASRSRERNRSFAPTTRSPGSTLARRAM